MEIILRENVEKLGSAGEIVNVAPGYARNYLFPKGLAMTKSKGNMKVWEMEAKSRELKKRKILKEADELKNALVDVSLTITMAAGEEDQLYGSVTSIMIAEELEKKNFNIDKNHILLDEPIKKLGVYDVSIKLNPETVTQIKVWVVKNEE